MYMLRPARCVDDRMHRQFIMISTSAPAIAADWLTYAPWYSVIRRDDWITAFFFDRVVIRFHGHETKRAALHVMPIDSVRQVWSTSGSFRTEYFDRAKSAYCQHLLVSFLRSNEQVRTSARCDILRLRHRSVSCLITGHAASSDKTRDWNMMLNSAPVYCTLYETKKTNIREHHEVKWPRHIVLCHP